MKIAVTGHRPNKLWGYNYYTEHYIKLGKVLKQLLIDNKATVAISGMALGVDQIFAMVAIKNKIPLHAYTPCPNQDKQWNSDSKILHRSLLDKAETVYVVSEEYSIEAMQKRNIAMVDNCDLLIAVWDGTAGGTANCVSYAKMVGKPMIRVNPREL